MELWDIYDSDKKRTGRTMKRNDWNLKNGEYHLTVLGVIHRRRTLFNYKKSHDKGLGSRLVGSFRRCCTGRRGFQSGSCKRNP